MLCTFVLEQIAVNTTVDRSDEGSENSYTVITIDNNKFAMKVTTILHKGNYKGTLVTFENCLIGCIKETNVNHQCGRF